MDKDRFASDHPARCPKCGLVESSPREPTVPVLKNGSLTAAAYRETNLGKLPGITKCFCGYTFTKLPGMHHAYDDEPCQDCIHGTCRRGVAPKENKTMVPEIQKKVRPAKPEGVPLLERRGENKQ